MTKAKKASTKAAKSKIMEEPGIQVWNELSLVEEAICVTETKSVFTLTNQYKVGMGELEVYYNGLRALKDFEYEEVNANTVRFLFNLNPPDIAIFRITRFG